MNAQPSTRPVVTAQRVRLVHEAVHVGVPRPTNAQAEPRIQLIREDGTVRAIDVTCRCGEVIRIVCEY